MLYYFRSNVILLLKETQGTSLEKSRNFFGEVKKLPKGNQGNSQTKPRNFKKKVQSIQERNPINLQSNLNPFAREGSLLRRGEPLDFVWEVLSLCFGEAFVLERDNDSFGSKKSA